MNQIISLKQIILYFNFILGILSWYTFIVCGETKYVNIYTVLLTNMLILENILILKYSIRNNNNITFILTIVITFFYLLRVVTLNYSSYSSTLEMYDFNFVNAINHTLIFIILSNFFMFLGIYCSNKIKINIKTKSFKSRIPQKIKSKNVLLLMMIANILAFSKVFQGSFLEPIIGYMNSLFFNIKYILLVCAIFFFYHSSIKKGNRRIFYILILLFVFGITISGSRSGILTVAIILLLASLTVKNDLYFKYKHLMYASLLIPISVLFFLFATFLRQTSSTKLSVVDRVNLIKSYDISDIDADNGIKIILSPVFDRMGFLDYSTDMIYYAPIYSKVVNFEYYFMSIVDNVLTPGFDVFDVPKVSIVLPYMHDNVFLIDKKFAENQGYLSAELTIYGEVFCLFGFLSLLVFFLIGYFLQFIYLLKLHDDFNTTLKNGVILFSFYTFINSFGIDWLVFDVLSLILAYYILIFSKKIVFSK